MIDDQPLRPVETGYRTVLRLQGMMLTVPLAIAALVADGLLARIGGFPVGVATGLAMLVLIYGVVIMPARRFNRWGYAVDAECLRVSRGYLFHTDTIVPFVRVQHIDVGQGPLERLCGVAHLVVHTAGTHNSIVTLPGLAPDTAAELRDTIRSSIQTDFA